RQVAITKCAVDDGPDQFPERLIPLVVAREVGDKPLPLYASTQNGREWLHVLDHCRAIELVLERGEPGETYDVGSGVEKSIEEIADAVLELTGKPGALNTIVPDRPGHDPRYPLDPAQHRHRPGGQDQTPWQDGLLPPVH